MAFDAESRQTQTVDSGTGQAISYTFDAAGQRVQAQIAGVTPACTTCYLVYL
jgi:hypothetical protein